MEGQKRFCGGVPSMLVALLVAALLAVGASASYANEWAIVPSSPGPTMPAIPTDQFPTVTFQFQSPPLSGIGEGTNVTVYTKNPAGDLFPHDDQADYFGVFRSPVDPTVYRGSATGRWSETPGTYYWQATTTTLEPPDTFVTYTSPLIPLTVTAGPPPIPQPLCDELGIGTRELTRRIRALQITLDRTHGKKRRRALQKTLNRLYRQRNALNREAYERCVRR
jgi:hypothetical protein